MDPIGRNIPWQCKTIKGIYYPFLEYEKTRRREEMRKEIFLLSRIIYRKINSIARRFSPCWRRFLLVVLVAEVFRGWKRLFPLRGCLGESFMGLLEM